MEKKHCEYKFEDRSLAWSFMKEVDGLEGATAGFPTLRFPYRVKVMFRPTKQFKIELDALAREGA